MPSKGIDLDALSDVYNDIVVLYGGGVFCGHLEGFDITDMPSGLDVIRFRIATHDNLGLSSKLAASDTAIGVLRKLLKVAVKHEDKESENLISGALTLLEL